MISKVWTFSKRLLKTSFGITFLIFIFLQLIFLAITKIPLLQPYLFEDFYHYGIENAQTAFLMFWVYILVLLNTIIFIIASHNPRSYISTLKCECCIKVRNQFNWFEALLIITVFLAGIMAYMIANEFFHGKSYDGFLSVLKIGEIVSLAIYTIFFIADLCCLKACEIALESESNGNASVFKDFHAEVKNYLLACDGPGLFGIALIALMSFTLRSELAGIYWQGFVTGAIGLHMAFSQSVLAFLSTNGVD